MYRTTATKYLHSLGWKVIELPEGMFELPLKNTSARGRAPSIELLLYSITSTLKESSEMGGELVMSQMLCDYFIHKQLKGYMKWCHVDNKWRDFISSNEQFLSTPRSQYGFQYGKQTVLNILHVEILTVRRHWNNYLFFANSACMRHLLVWYKEISWPCKT